MNTLLIGKRFHDAPYVRVKAVTLTAPKTLPYRPHVVVTTTRYIVPRENWHGSYGVRGLIA